MTVTENLGGRLDAFLAPHGHRAADLLHDSDLYGDPVLVVATGSVLAGYANGDSDVDVWVVVDNPEVTAFPVMSYDLGCRVELGFYSVETLVEAVAAIAEPWPGEQISRTRWIERYRAVSLATRIALGLPLVATERGRQVLDGLGRAQLRDAVEAWWTVEALRRWSVSRLLEAARPAVAAELRCDAVYFALEARCAREDQLYFTVKWLSEKLRERGDHEGLAWLRSAMDLPVGATDTGAYNQRIDGLLTHLLDRPRLGALRNAGEPAPGVVVRPAGVDEVISRWDLRGLVVPDGTLARASATTVDVATLLEADDASDVVGDDTLALVAADFVWLGIEEAT